MSSIEPPIALPKRPTATEDFAATIRAAAQSNAQIRLTGSNSLPLARFDPARPIQKISTLRLNKVLEHAIPDMTIIVQAGITLEALQRHLAWHNQWLPIDPPTIAKFSPSPSPLSPNPSHRTLAGLIATNSLGPLRFSCAGAADWRLFIMGMKWIDAAGAVIKGGGRTVKNVAGYSTPRLMIGSCGSLGAIAEVTLRTFARPQDEQCVIFFCTSAEQAESLLVEILTGKGSSTTPSYIEAIAAKTFTTNPLQLPSPKNGIALVAGFLDRPQACAAQIETLRALPAARGIESISQTAAQAGRLRLWMTAEPSLESLTNQPQRPPSQMARADGLALSEEPFESEAPAPAPGIGFRLHALSSEICPLIAAIESAAKTSGVKTWLVSEAATGILRGAIASPDAAHLLQDLLSTHAPNANLLITQGPAESTAVADSSNIATRIKSELDPANTFGVLPF